MNGYKCTVQTDTEVVSYIWDLLVRRHKLPIQAAAFAMAPWTYEEIARLDPESRKLATWLRIAYREAFLNGPFSDPGRPFPAGDHPHRAGRPQEAETYAGGQVRGR